MQQKQNKKKTMSLKGPVVQINWKFERKRAQMFLLYQIIVTMNEGQGIKL